jgi:hypothetical protein
MRHSHWYFPCLTGRPDPVMVWLTAGKEAISQTAAMTDGGPAAPKKDDQKAGRASLRQS